MRNCKFFGSFFRVFLFLEDHRQDLTITTVPILKTHLNLVNPQRSLTQNRSKGQIPLTSNQKHPNHHCHHRAKKRNQVLQKLQKKTHPCLRIHGNQWIAKLEFQPQKHCQFCQLLTATVQFQPIIRKCLSSQKTRQSIGTRKYLITC